MRKEIDDEDAEEEDNDLDAQSSKQLIRSEFQTLLKSSSKSNDIEMKPLKEEDEEEEDDKTRLSSALGGDRRKRSSNISSSQASSLINRTNVRIEFSKFSGTSSKSDEVNDDGNQATISGN